MSLLLSFLDRGQSLGIAKKLKTDYAEMTGNPADQLNTVMQKNRSKPQQNYGKMRA